jgi:hypothetical protein
MHRTACVSAFVTATLVALSAVPASAAFGVIFGTSWDGVSLQEVLDAEYGVSAINATTDYEGYSPADADPPFWLDQGLDGVIVREIAGYRDNNTLGWYGETFSKPTIDGINDGVVFTGPMVQGATATVTFPSGVTRFGFYLNPNGSGDSTNAPEPEMFFTNRAYNDIGPNGTSTVHGPTDGDPQCLIYNITRLRGGVPTFVLAWEDLDSGTQITQAFDPNGTDNDFQDLVVEIAAASPVPSQQTSWGRVKSLYEAGR